MDVYLDPATAPLDTPTPDIGDWSPTSKTRFSGSPEQYETAVQTSLIVPFTRPIGLGTYGKDVIGIKRAIWPAAGLKRPKNATEVFGQTAVKLTKEVQAKHKLTQDGVVGPATLKVVAPYMDEYGFLLYEGYYPPGPNETWQTQSRNMIVAYNLWAYNNRVPIHYGEIRPMMYMNQLYRLPVTEDCSTVATKGYDFAHEKYPQVPDPNGLNFDGSGYTGTMLDHGTVVSIQDVLPGDLCFYRSPAHVSTFVTEGTLPDGSPGRVVSHGNEQGPSLLNWNYRPDTISIRSYF